MKKFNWFKMLFAVLFVGGMLPAGASAQSALNGTFHMDREVRWGTAVLAPGDYTLTIDSISAPVRAIIRSTDNKHSVIVISESSGDAHSTRSLLRLAPKGNRWVVLSLELPQLHRSFVYDNVSGQEQREELAKDVQTIAIQSASR
jgi:hypothetical protein